MVPDSTVMSKISQPFFSAKPKGTVVGLAISKRLIENHGGTISVANNMLGGETFRMSLTVTQVNQKQTT